MALSGQQLKQIQDALLAAYDQASLRQLVRLYLDVSLEQIAGGENLRDIAFNLAQWADRNNRVLPLIAGACQDNPENQELQTLQATAQTWRLEPAAAGSAPYQGLAFFDVADADRFFGREALTVQLVTYLKDHRFLAVVGASGSGKSSLVRAGVLTALRKDEAAQGSDRWATFIVTPTARPLETLAIALALPGEAEDGIARFKKAQQESPDSLHLRARRLLVAVEKPHLLLVIDQFEELFTLCKDSTERKAFIDNLLAAAAPDGVTTVIITLRADFYAHCAEYDNLRTALEQHQRYIGGMSPAELRAAIEAPARQGGWDLEPGLADLMLDDVTAEPGALPLLSHALLATWQRRQGKLLTFAGYRAAGGVKGAIAKTADATFAALTSAQQAIAKSIFLRLTELGEGVQDTRRRASLTELASLAEVDVVLQKLEDARLVTAERTGAQATFLDVTHEALIREWPQLRQWLDEDRDGLRLHRRLTEAAQAWAGLERDPGALYRGVQLQQAQAWAAGREAELNALERAFLAASVAQVDAERQERERVAQEREAARQRELAQSQALAAEQQRRAEEQMLAANQLRERNRWFLAALVVAVALAGVAGVAGYMAQANADLAQKQLDALAGEQLLAQARDYKAALAATAAITSFQAAAAYPKLGIKLSDEISGTLRFVATTWVQEGERLLRETSGAPFTPTMPYSPTVVIQPEYLAWAAAVAQQTAGWPLEAPVSRQQAIISATALFSQALALNPPPDTPVYVWIEPGEFAMGSTDEQIQYAMQLCKDAGNECSPDGFSSEQKSHPVRLAGYWIQRTEVTNEQYKRCYDAGGCPDKPFNSAWDKPRNARLPVTDVTWLQANDYARWVGGRLPTEAEWEQACRGLGGNIFPWGNDPPMEELANYARNVGDTIEVGSYPAGAGPYGMLDMAGNVSEWTSSKYADYLYDANDRREEPADDDSRTLRGGSWFYHVNLVRCASRLVVAPDSRLYDVGFRVLSPGFGS